MMMVSFAGIRRFNGERLIQSHITPSLPLSFRSLQFTDTVKGDGPAIFKFVIQFNGTTRVGRMFPDVFICSIIRREQDITIIAIDELLIPSKVVRREYRLRVHGRSGIELSNGLAPIIRRT